MDCLTGTCTKNRCTSPYKKYRYKLYKDLNNGKEGTCVFILLNPRGSKEGIISRTVQKCMDVANCEGYGNIIIVNLCAYTAIDGDRLICKKKLKKDLARVRSDYEIKNDEETERDKKNKACVEAAIKITNAKLIGGWGTKGENFKHQVSEIKRLAKKHNKEIHHLGLVGAYKNHPHHLGDRKLKRKKSCGTLDLDS